MEDFQSFGSTAGLLCDGTLDATRCTFEEIDVIGLVQRGHEASAKLTECVIRNNTSDGLRTLFGATATVRGITEHGVFVDGYDGKVTVALTVSSGNGKHDWATSGTGIPVGHVAQLLA